MLLEHVTSQCLFVCFFASINVTKVAEETKSFLSMVTRSLPESQDRLYLQQTLDDSLDSSLLITNHKASSEHSKLLLFLCYIQGSGSPSTPNKPSFLWFHLFPTLSRLVSIHAPHRAYVPKCLIGISACPYTWARCSSAFA